MRKEDFPILNERVHNKPLVYLDNAATSQKPQAVIDAIAYAYSHFNANIHRGVHSLSQLATRHHEEAREKVARWLGAKESKEIVFTKGTTDGVNLLAFSYGEAFVGEGDEIVVSEVEHHSNIVPWQMLCERKKAVLKVIPMRDDYCLDIEAYSALLSEKTKLVSVALVSNVLGTRNPVEEIIRLAHEKHIPVCVDAAQGAAHEKVDVVKMDCDFLVLSAHKLYGPTGLGVLYGKEEWLEKLPPAEGGGEMIEHVKWEKTTYNTLPYKFEAGTPNYVGSYAFGAALDYINELGGMEEIERYEKALTRQLEDGIHAANLSGCKAVVYADGMDKSGAVSFNLYNLSGQLIHPYDVGVLLDQQGVAVRTGHHCAEPLIDRLGVPGTIRASIGLYNDEEDIRAFIRALERAAAMLG